MKLAEKYLAGPSEEEMELIVYKEAEDLEMAMELYHYEAIRHT